MNIKVSLEMLKNIKRIEFQYYLITLLAIIIISTRLKPEILVALERYTNSIPIKQDIVIAISDLLIVLSSVGATIGIIVFIIMYLFSRKLNASITQRGFQLNFDLFWGNISLPALNLYIILCELAYLGDRALFNKINVLFGNQNEMSIILVPVYLMCVLNILLIMGALKYGIAKEE